MKNFKKLLISLLLLVGLSACNNVPSGSTSNAANNKQVTAVSLDKTGEVVMEIGEVLTVTATITYKEEPVAADMFWTSSRPSVATVTQEGVVTALAGGSSTISFVAGYEVAFFTVTIYSDKGVPVSSAINLSTYARSLEIGAEFTLGVTLVNPTGLDETVTFTSENAAIASVNENGLVKAVAEGKTNIVVSAIGLTAKCEIIVDKPGEGPGPDEGEEDIEYDFTVYFFIDYNNIDENDETGTKLLAKFGWYHNELIPQDKIPANPTTPLDPAFEHFVGWSTHTIIDTKDDLIDFSTFKVENAHFLFVYGIWSDVGGFDL